MNIERADAVKRLKKALKTITGKTWSVKGSRGTAWGWIDIQAPKSRRVGHTPDPAWKHWEADPDEPGYFENPDAPKDEKWYTSKADGDTLADIFDKPGFYHQGMSVSPDGREWHVLKAEEKVAAMTGDWTSPPVLTPVIPEDELGNELDPNRPTWLLTGPEEPESIRPLAGTQKIKQRQALGMALEWIENLMAIYGQKAIVDALPNNTGGRVWLQEALGN